MVDELLKWLCVCMEKFCFGDLFDKVIDMGAIVVFV